MSKAINDVLAERKRQQQVEGWTPEHDDEHRAGDLARAGATYAMAAGIAAGGDTSALPAPYDWPWEPQCWKPTNSRRDLIKAAALLIAEIERLDRAAGIKTYIKITFKDNDWCICEPHEVAAMTANADGYKTEEVHMTEAEFEELPEFQG